jgi:hypothetical protein
MINNYANIKKTMMMISNSYRNTRKNNDQGLGLNNQGFGCKSRFSSTLFFLVVIWFIGG